MDGAPLRPFKSSEFMQGDNEPPLQSRSPTPFEFQGVSYEDAPESRDLSNANSDDESSDEELEELSKYITSKTSQPYNEAVDQDEYDIDTRERKYIYDLLGDASTEGLSMARYEGWLGKDVLLQGKIFLTSRYLLFYAHLPPVSMEVLKASPLAKKSSRTLGKSSYRRYWFILRMGCFSWYDQPSDVYFPVGLLSLSLMSSVSQVVKAPERFVIKAQSGKTYTFKADSRNACHEWVKAIQKEMFRARNKNTIPAAVVRIPLENIFYINTLKPLDVVKIVNIQLITSPFTGTAASEEPAEVHIPGTPQPSQSSQNRRRPHIGRYSFAFFANSDTTHNIVNRILSITQDLQNQRQVKFIEAHNSKEVDFENSVFGPTSEEVFDTTPPGQFNIFDGRDIGDDREILRSDDAIFEGGGPANEILVPTSSAVHTPQGGRAHHGGSQSSTAAHSPTTPSSILTPKHSGSRLHSLLPSRSSTPTNSYCRHKSKINILSTLNEKLHKLKTDEFFKPDASALKDVATMPMKLIPFNSDSNDVSENEDESDSSLDDRVYDDEEESGTPLKSSSQEPGLDSHESSNNPLKFLDDKFLPFIPQNHTKKLICGANSSSSGSSNNTSFSPSGDLEKEGIEVDSVKGKDDMDLLNKWFREHFGLDPSVSLIAEYICGLKKPGDNASWTGKLFISGQFLCFQRRNVSGGNWRMVIPMRDIIHLREQPRGSSKIEFEVAETGYSAFRLTFSESVGRRDAEMLIKDLIKSANYRSDQPAPQNRRNSSASDFPADDTRSVSNQSTVSQSSDLDSEHRFLEYSLRSARLATYEPTMTNRMRHKIPPLIFDPTSTQYKEIFLQKPMKQLKFVMLMIGSRGDVQPYIALCQGLMEEGHKCCIATHKEFKDWIEEFGIEFVEIAGDPSELMEVMISHGSISYGFVRDALSHFKGWLKDLMRTCWKALKHSGADVLIESPSSMIGIHIAEALNIPYYRAFTMPWTRTKAYPQALIAPDQKIGGGYNYFTYLMYDRLVWFGISKYVNKWRKKHLDLPETDLDSMRQEDVPFLYCVSPTVLVPPIDQPDWVHTTGYWELRQDKKSNEGEKHPDLMKFIAKARELKKPLVYIGFGSIIVNDPEAMTQTVVEATEEAGVYCVLARGWSSRGQKKKDKENKHKDDEEKQKPLEYEHIHEVESVPHQWLFPQMDACVHHGGSGTTGASLRAGKPTIVKPFFGDQYFYGRRVEDLGVGCYLKKLTKSELSESLKECVSNRQMIRQAKVLGEQIRHEHGVEEAILCIYRELAYAQDVTYRRRKLTLEASKNILPDPTQLLHPFKSKIEEEVKATEAQSNDHSKHSHSWFSLPKFGRREEQRQDRNSSGEVDVSV